MSVNILTVRVFSGGEVVAVRQAPFLVLREGETLEQGETELWRMAEILEQQAGEIEAARHNREHRRHHWWLA